MKVKPNSSTFSSRCRLKKAAATSQSASNSPAGVCRMAKTVSEAKLAMPRIAAPRAVRRSPAAADSAASSTKSGRRCDANVLLEDRDQRPRLPEGSGFVDGNAAGLLAGRRRGEQFADDLLGRNRRQEEPLEHGHWQRRDVGQRAASLRADRPGGRESGRRAGSAPRHPGIARAESPSAQRPSRLAAARIAVRESTARLAARCSSDS